MKCVDFLLHFLALIRSTKLLLCILVGTYISSCITQYNPHSLPYSFCHNKHSGTYVCLLLLFCSEPGALRPPRPSRPLVPDLLSHQLVRGSSERITASAATSKLPLTEKGLYKHSVNSLFGQQAVNPVHLLYIIDLFLTRPRDNVFCLNKTNARETLHKDAHEKFSNNV